MRPFFLSLAILFLAHDAPAQERILCWKYGLFSGGIHFSIPRAVTFTGAAFLKEQEQRRLLRRVYNLKVLVAPPEKAVRQKDIKRYFKRAHRRHLEEILVVRDGKTQVRILAKTRKDALRKVVVLVSSPEDGLVLFSMRGKLRLNDINKVLKKLPIKKEDPLKKYLPDMA
jgi:hypothetical protein